MSSDPILHLIGLARKAGRLELGEEPVGAACRARHAKLVLLAADAAANTCRRAAHFGQTGNVLWLVLPHTKADLGFALGRSSCAMLALTDIGLASSIVQRLARLDPDRYGHAAETLQLKAQKALQRQKEQRQHEKNLREGKRKPWAPPPAEQPSKKAAAPRANQPEPTSTAPRKPGPAGRNMTGRATALRSRANHTNLKK